MRAPTTAQIADNTEATICQQVPGMVHLEVRVECFILQSTEDCVKGISPKDDHVLLTSTSNSW